MNEFLIVEAGERAPQRLRRKGLDLADQAIGRLDAMATGDQKALHDVRRRLKELRSLTALLRQPDGEFFRDAGRELADYRDAKATVEAFDRLRERFSTEWTPRQFLKVRRALESRVRANVEQPIIERLRAGLLVERGQIAAWTVDEMKREELWSELTRSYKRARRAMRLAMQEKTPENLHDWRKRVKIHWYHAQFFADVGLARFEPHTDLLRKLSRTLGPHHDFVIIDELCRNLPGLFGSARYVRKFRSFVARQLSELEVDVESIGRTIFATRARNWEVRMRLTAAPQDVLLRIGPRKSPARTTRSSAITA
ncbi:MAG TPA: CHAD domain-containing protein [Thermoanaerobaculia bacterium]|nr:CHAD domain-containing protein [Thermoanaerobaculia bacterium]